VGYANVLFRNSGLSEGQKGTLSGFENTFWNFYKNVSLKFNMTVV